MTTKSKKYGLLAVALLVGAGTITLFQNCSSGGMPNLDQQSATSVAPTVALASLSAMALSNPVASGGSTVLSISGGDGNYTPTAQTGCGTVVQNAVSGAWTFNAPTVTTATSCLVSIVDGQQNSYPLTISVNASAPPVQAVTPPASKQIYAIERAFTLNYSDVQDTSNGAGATPAFFLASSNVAGAVPYYRCQLPSSYIPAVPYYYLDTASPVCDNAATYTEATAPKTLLGYIYATSDAVTGLIPLYRFHKINTFSTDFSASATWVIYLDTTNPSDPNAAGMTSDGVRGYVPQN